MFDEEDYYSDEEDNVYQTHKALPSSKVLTPASNSDFNHLTGDGENILKMMKERGSTCALTQSTSPIIK